MKNAVGPEVNLPPNKKGSEPLGETLHKQEKKIVEGLNSYLQALKDISPHFEDISQYPAVLQTTNKFMPAIYSAYDQFIQLELETLTRKITCEKSCSACCSHFVASVEPFELIYLDGILKTRPDYGNLLFQLSGRHSVFDSLLDRTKPYNEDQLLYKYLKKDLACPFLSLEDSCIVYHNRPMPCRMFFSLSHPKFCRGAHTVDPQNQNFLVELSDHVEVTISQISYWFREWELPNLFFPGLLKVNEIFGEYS